MGIAQRLDRGDPPDDLGRGGLIFVMERSRPLHSMCQDAAVVGAADDEPDPACRAQRQEAVERPLFEQRVASREQHHVEIAGGKRPPATLPFLYTETDCTDRAPP